jgi:hypothetical protein
VVEAGGKIEFFIIGCCVAALCVVPIGHRCPNLACLGGSGSL